MSWSVSYVGKPAKVIEALKANSEKLTGQSKVEYDDALPHIVGLLEQTHNVSEDKIPLIKLSAAGSGYVVDGVEQQRQCTLTIEQIYGNLV